MEQEIYVLRIVIVAMGDGLAWRGDAATSDYNDDGVTIEVAAQ